MNKNKKKWKLLWELKLKEFSLDFYRSLDKKYGIYGIIAYTKEKEITELKKKLEEMEIKCAKKPLK